MELENSQEIENYSRGLFGNHIEHISYILNESIIHTLKYSSIGIDEDGTKRCTRHLLRSHLGTK